MELIINNQDKNLLLILFLVVSFIFISLTYNVNRPTFHPYYNSFSKIDEGEIIIRDDSIATIIIPDDR
jgi:flagellar biosynthesis/type III secretory pathway M-ring protein FliF/YscJ